MPRGGKRPGFGGVQPGAGRPFGALNKRTHYVRRIQEDAIKAGVLPIEIMLGNMRYYHEMAQVVGVEFDDKLRDLREKVGTARDQSSDEETSLILKRAADALEAAARALERLDDLRMKAQSCAADAAPFVHPKLAQIAVTNEDSEPLRVEIDNITPDERARMFYEEMKNIKSGGKPSLLLEHQAENQADSDAS